MHDESENTAVLAVGGIVQAISQPSASASATSVLRVGPSAGWLIPKGIADWEHEISIIARSDLTTELARSLRATLPVEQIAPKRFPMASEAVATSAWLALSPNLAADVRKAGIRVHTIGVDRVSAGFYYFAEGGPGEPTRVQANLVEMVTPSVGASSTNADIAALVRDSIDRLLFRFSAGALSELDVELAGALPRLSRDGTGMVGIDLDGFEATARRLAERSAPFQPSAWPLVEALDAADAEGRSVARIPLYGEAKKSSAPPLEAQIAGTATSLAARPAWIVTGAPRTELAKPATPARAFAVPAVARPPTPAGTFVVPGPPRPPTPARAFNVPPIARPATPVGAFATAAPTTAPTAAGAFDVAGQSRRGAAAAMPTSTPVQSFAAAASPPDSPAFAPHERQAAASPQERDAAVVAKEREPAVALREREPAAVAPPSAPEALTAVSLPPEALVSMPPSAAVASPLAEPPHPVAPGEPARAAAASPWLAETAGPSTQPPADSPRMASSRHEVGTGRAAQEDAPPRDARLGDRRGAPNDALLPRPMAPAALRRDPLRTAAAAAPQRRGPFSALGTLFLILLAVLAYFVGRWIRHHFIDVP